LFGKPGALFRDLGKRRRDRDVKNRLRDTTLSAAVTDTTVCSTNRQ
jgi:hypothetical protein